MNHLQDRILLISAEKGRRINEEERKRKKKNPLLSGTLNLENNQALKTNNKNLLLLSL